MNAKKKKKEPAPENSEPHEKVCPTCRRPLSDLTPAKQQEMEHYGYVMRRNPINDDEDFSEA